MLWEGARVGRWIVDRQIGEGDGASLWVAHDHADGTVVALKVPSFPSPAGVVRFGAEMRCHQRVRHPNVVRAYEELAIGAVKALVLQHVEGPTLAALLAQGELTPTQIQGLAEGLMAGLGAIHAGRVIHRDLRPEHVLIAREGDRMVPMITAFGAARLITTTTPPGAGPVSVGAPGYTAPEQFRDPERVGFNADVFSLGATLYELVCGVPPFSGDTFRMLNDIAAQRYIRPSRLVEIEPHVEAAIMGALHPDPARRTPDVDTLWRTWHGEAPRNGWIRPEIPAHLVEGPPSGFLEDESAHTLIPLTPPPADDPREADLTLPDPESSTTLWSLAVPATVLVLAALGVALLRSTAPEPPSPEVPITQPASGPAAAR